MREDINVPLHVKSEEGKSKAFFLQSNFSFIDVREDRKIEGYLSSNKCGNEALLQYHSPIYQHPSSKQKKKKCEKDETNATEGRLENSMIAGSFAYEHICCIRYEKDHNSTHHFQLC